MKFLKNHPISIFLVIGLVVFVLFCWKKLFESTSAEEINYFIFLATGVLAFIAFIEFQRANKLTGNEFLLFLSNRWGCKEIIIARQIIHDFFVHNYRDTTSPVSKDYPGALHHTAKDISTYFFNIDKLYRDLKKYKSDSF